MEARKKALSKTPNNVKPTYSSILTRSPNKQNNSRDSSTQTEEASTQTVTNTENIFMDKESFLEKLKTCFSDILDNYVNKKDSPDLADFSPM